jgi:hypothetical protein
VSEAVSEAHWVEAAGARCTLFFIFFHVFSFHIVFLLFLFFCFFLAVAALLALWPVVGVWPLPLSPSRLLTTRRPGELAMRVRGDEAVTLVGGGRRRVGASE